MSSSSASGTSGIYICPSKTEFKQIKIKIGLCVLCEVSAAKKVLRISLQAEKPLSNVMLKQVLKPLSLSHQRKAWLAPDQPIAGYPAI